MSEVRLRHHGSGPSSFENVPVGPFASRSARRTGSRAACWTVRVPWKLLRSVAVKPGHAALTLMRVDSSSKAKASVIALSAVFDEEWLPNRAVWVPRVRVHRERAAGARDVNDAPRRRFAKEREHRLRDRDDAEHVRLEHRAHLVERCDAQTARLRHLLKRPARLSRMRKPELFTSTSRRPSSFRMRSAAAATEA